MELSRTLNCSNEKFCFTFRGGDQNQWCIQVLCSLKLSTSHSPWTASGFWNRENTTSMPSNRQNSTSMPSNRTLRNLKLWYLVMLIFICLAQLFITSISTNKMVGYLGLHSILSPPTTLPTPADTLLRLVKNLTTFMLLKYYRPAEAEKGILSPLIKQRAGD